VKNLYVCIDLYTEGRLVCDIAGDRAIFRSMCKIVTRMEAVGKWQLLDINKVCLKLACVLSSVVCTNVILQSC